MIDPSIALVSRLSEYAYMIAQVQRMPNAHTMEEDGET
jgi:hypothetical protein